MRGLQEDMQDLKEDRKTLIININMLPVKKCQRMDKKSHQSYVYSS